MTSQFPDPAVTPEFTGENGITYSWDGNDQKWVIKGFGGDGEYVSKAGDDMTGPITVSNPGFITDDDHLVNKGYVDQKILESISTTAKLYRAKDGPPGAKGEVYLGYYTGNRHVLNLSATDMLDQAKPDLNTIKYVRILGDGVDEIGELEQGTYWMRNEPTRLRLTEYESYLFWLYQ